jgi:1,4-dihydroxy-6-naphthoate synthase
MTKPFISIAYSPDTDDQFMILALREKIIPWGPFEFKFIVDDIQKLNSAAQGVEYDITAISVGAYPLLKKDYLLMDVGASIGDEFGPAVVTRPGSPFTNVDQLSGCLVAVPGLNTSAYIAAQALFGPFQAVPMYFMDIGDAVSQGKVDAGLLIHELQLNPESQNLVKITDLGRLWHDRFQLPLPLGANAIRRDLGSETIEVLTKMYRDSIEYGLQTRHESVTKAVRSAAARDSLNLPLGDKYISMYVNDRSLSFQEDSLKGIEKLFELGAGRNLFEPVDMKSSLANSTFYI